MLSIINIFCLAVGITFSIMIGVFVLDSERVNTDIKSINSQYIIKSKWKQDNMGVDITTLGPLAKAMKDEYPNLVANYYRFDPVTNIVSVRDKHFRTQISIGDTTLVSMYGFHLVYGNNEQAFKNNQSAIVTEDFAIKFFGKADVVDEVISIQTPSDGRKHDFVISAVLKTSPTNSVENFTGPAYEVFLPMDANQYFQGGDKGDNWANVFMVSMLQLQKGINPSDLEKPFARVLEKYQPPFVKGNLRVQVVPMNSYYLEANNWAIEKTLTTLSLIAALILLLAIINFVNISIGTSAYRLKEIGLRKVFGGAKIQLIAQYISESLVLTFTAAIISLVLYEILRPVFGQLVSTTFEHFWQFNVYKVFFLLLLVGVVGVTSGIYPAFVLSSTNVIIAMKGKIDSNKGGLILRRVLLIIQFTLAIVVFISAFNVSKQVSYFFNKDLGYNKGQVVIISSLPRQWDSSGIAKMEMAKNQLLNSFGVKNVSLSYDIPDGNEGSNLNVYPQNNNNFISMIGISTDADFANVYGIKLKEGIFINYIGGAYVPGRVVLNETAAKALGWEYPVIGKTLRLGGLDGPLLKIVGVVRDFHFESLQKSVQPLLIYNMNEPFSLSYRYFSIKLNTTNISECIHALRDKWKSLFPDTGFEYSFMDEKFQSLYHSELQLQNAVDIATTLSLIIAFLGVFGVISFTLAKRTKEIAVRKVLGADIRSIITIFLKEYAVLILVSNIIAWPFAYSITNKWLQNYAYRIQQDFVPYLFVFVVVFLLAFILITVQSLKAANANPITTLRSE